MDLRLAVLCDAANVSREGKLNILGEFNAIWAEKVPFKWPLMFLVVRFHATVGEGGKHKIGVRVVTDDGGLIATVDGEVELAKPFKPGLPFRGQFIFAIEGAVFPHFGTFDFEVLVDGHRIGSAPLYISPVSDHPKFRKK